MVEQSLVEKLCAGFDDVEMRRLVVEFDRSLEAQLPGHGASRRVIAEQLVELAIRHGRLKELEAAVQRRRPHLFESTASRGDDTVRRGPGRRSRWRWLWALILGPAMAGVAPLWIARGADAERLAIVDASSAPVVAPRYLYIPRLSVPPAGGSSVRVRPGRPRSPAVTPVTPVIPAVPAAAVLAGEAHCGDDQRCRLQATAGRFHRPVAVCFDVHIEGVQVACMVQGHPRDTDSVTCDRSDPASSYPLKKGVYSWRQCP